MVLYVILAVVAAILGYLAFGRRKAVPRNFEFTDLPAADPVVEVAPEPVAEPVAELPVKKTKKSKKFDSETPPNPNEQAQ